MKQLFLNRGKYTGQDARRRNRRILGFAVIFLCLMGLLLTRTGKQEESNPEITTGETSYSDVSSLISDGSGPETGTVFYRKYKTNPASLHIANESTADACIQCADGLFNRGVIQFYVRAGEETAVDVPVGYFELHIAIGETWVNEEELFGENTMFFSDSSKYGQEFSRKKPCEFVIRETLDNLIPIPREKY